MRLLSLLPIAALLGAGCPSFPADAYYACTKADGCCHDTVLSGDETDVDCGGSICAPCAVGRHCKVENDCQSKVCDQAAEVCLAHN